MKTRPCYLCGSQDVDHLETFADDPYLARLEHLPDKSVSYVVCRSCSLVYQNPMLEAQELDEMYGKKYRKELPDETFIGKNSKFTDARAAWIEAHLPTVMDHKRVLDVGCGAGMLLHSFQKRGWEVTGVEPTAAYAEFGSTRFGIEIVPGFYTKETFPGQQFDVITLSQVLEHAMDPGQMLRDCRAALADGGLLFVGVPTLMRPQRPVHPNTLAAPHLWIFSLPTLTRLLQREGFEVVASDCDFKGVMALAKPAAVAASVSMNAPIGVSEPIVVRYQRWRDKESLYYTNLSALKERWPALAKRMDYDLPLEEIEAVKPSETYVNVKFRTKEGKSHWLYGGEPFEAANKALDKHAFGSEGLVIVFGLAMGYMQKLLLDRLGKGHVLVIYERCESFLKVALEHVDLTVFLRDKRVELVIGDDLGRLDHVLAQHSTKYMLTGRLALLQQGMACKWDPAGYKKAHERIGERLKVIQVNKNTRMGLGHLMLKNSLENMHQIMRLPGVNRLKDLFKGKPAIIVSAGPSLQKNLALLKEAQGRAVIIACDTVLRLLVPNGIVPDFTVTADPQEMSYRKFRDIPMDPQSAIVCHPINYPDMIRTFAGRKFAIGSNMSIYRWLSSCCPEKGQLDAGTQSVAHMAFNLAVLLGADPIIFVGQDLCFYDNRKYAGHLSKGSPWERRVLKGKKKTVPAEDIFKAPVETETLFQSFKVLMEDLIKRSRAQCINATEGGIGLKGTTVMTLRDAIDRYCQGEPLGITDRVRRVGGEEREINVARLKKELESAKKSADEVIKDSEKVLRDVRRAKRMLKHESKESAGEQIERLSKVMERHTIRVRDKQKVLNLLGEYAVSLELYMNSQRIIDVDNIEDPRERFRKQVGRAYVYYRGLLRVLRPFADGVKTLQGRVQEWQEVEGWPRETVQQKLKALARYKRLGYFQEAMALAEAVLRERPGHLEAAMHLAEMQVTLHHPAEAQALLDQVAPSGKQSMRRDGLAKECEEKAKAWEQKRTDAVAQYVEQHPLDNGHFYYRLADYDAAIDRYTRAIEATPTSEGYYHLGHAYIARGDRDRAVEMLEHAIRLAPENPVLYRDVGLLAVDNGQDELAEQFWMEALTLGPDDAYLHDLLASLYQRRRDFKRAVEVFEQLVQLYPDRQDLLARFGGFCQELLAEARQLSVAPPSSRVPAGVISV
jgi:Tfp pilus assembly protein PilF